MNAVEILGYVAMVLVATSFLLKDMIKLRLMNAVGAICFVIYGFLVGSYPVAGLNIFVTCVNAYYIWKGLQERKA